MSRSKEGKNMFDFSFKKLKPLIIIIFGSSISKFFLDNNYKGKKIISTYSLVEMINNPNYKKYVWNDLKQILNMIE